ncbi:UDP-glucose 4-epimerase-like [Nilaparvata lugens]|uniref:UDP-glucose 4-epimerase-like n=1 Tax=Nilaparvata lugens TaxID=108931 RepID=UPI00193DCA48|nr:UDP-glucose 4-epimerase-like [Nilaparvata lugens]
MKEKNVTKLVFSSSSTVYGNPEYLPICEKHPTGRSCTNPYGKSKYFVEEILRDLVTSDKTMNVISLRYFNPVGAHCSGEIGEYPTGAPNNLMPYVAQVAIGRRNELLVFGNDYDTPDGTGVGDYIDIMDLAEGHVVALENILQTSSVDRFNVFNLGTGRDYSVLEVINAFSEVSGRQINYRFVGRRDGDIAVSYCSPNLAKETLGWTAKRDLKQMCGDMWRWQMKNPNGFHKNQQSTD